MLDFACPCRQVSSGTLALKKRTPWAFLLGISSSHFSCFTETQTACCFLNARSENTASSPKWNALARKEDSVCWDQTNPPSCRAKLTAISLERSARLYIRHEPLRSRGQRQQRTRGQELSLASLDDLGLTLTRGSRCPQEDSELSSRKSSSKKGGAAQTKWGFGRRGGK